VWIKALKGTQISFIAAGISHNVAITKEGKAFAWGRNHSGQCGAQASSVASTPVQLPDTDKEFIFYATAGFGITYCIALSGKVFSYGNGTSDFFDFYPSDH